MSYIKVLAQGFPTVEAYCEGDDSDYSNLVWTGGSPLPSQETLDAWREANPDHESRIITSLAFRNRFTLPEKVAIELAAIDNPSADMSARQGSASIRAMLKDLDVASWVDLSRPDTIAGVLAMEQFGILGAGRASEILNDPIQAVERPVDFRAFLAKGIS